LRTLQKSNMEIVTTLSHLPDFFDPSWPSTENLNGDQRLLIDRHNSRILSGEILLEEVSCLCQSEQFALLAQYDRYRIRLQTVICRACGLIQSNPRMTEEENNAFYTSDTYRALYDPQIINLSSQDFDFYVAKSSYRHEFVQESLPKVNFNNVLELGCGGGWNLWQYKEKGAKIIGYDLSPTLTKFGQGLGLDLRQGSLEDIDEKGFDLIIASHVIEHFLNPIKSVRQLVSKLSDQGYMYIEVPNADYFCLGGLQNAHTYYFTPRTLAAYMSDAGLIMVSGREFGSHFAGLFQKSNMSPRALVSDEYQRMRKVIYRYEQRERSKRLLGRLGLLSFLRQIKKFLQLK